MPERPLRARIRALPFLQDAWRFLNQRRSRVYLVGGAVRDLLIKRKLKRDHRGRNQLDLDLAITGDVMTIARKLAKKLGMYFVKLDEEHETVRLVLDTPQDVMSLDIAALRASSIRGDLHLRDFTINALAVDLERVFAPGGGDNVMIIDVTGGCRDLEKRQVRITGLTAFPDDPLRTLRAFRMAAQLDFSVTEDTVAEAGRCAHMLERVSRERVRDELFKIMDNSCSGAHLEAARCCGVLPAALPQANALMLKDWVSRVRSLENVVRAMGTISDMSRYIEEDGDDCLVTGRTRRSLIKLSLLVGCLDGNTVKPVKKLGKSLALARREESSLSEYVGAVRLLVGEESGICPLAQPQLDAIIREPLADVRSEQVARKVFKAFKHAGRPGFVGALLAGVVEYQFLHGLAPGSQPAHGENDEKGSDVSLKAPNVSLKSPNVFLEGVRVLQEFYAGARLFKWRHKVVDGGEIMRRLGIKEGPLVGQIQDVMDEGIALGRFESWVDALEWVRTDYLPRIFDEYSG